MQAVVQRAWTGDEAADYLVNSKMALAASQGIQVNTKIEFPRHTNIRSVDLVAILGNLLDNALEAAADAKESLRFINLTLRRINEMLIIKVENGCRAAPTAMDGGWQASKAGGQAGGRSGDAAADGKWQTSKDDKALHGWGLESVRTAAERYDGAVETEYRGQVFCAVVTLSFEKRKELSH